MTISCIPVVRPLSSGTANAEANDPTFHDVSTPGSAELAFWKGLEYRTGMELRFLLEQRSELKENYVQLGSALDILGYLSQQKRSDTQVYRCEQRA